MCVWLVENRNDIVEEAFEVDEFAKVHKFDAAWSEGKAALNFAKLRNIVWLICENLIFFGLTESCHIQFNHLHQTPFYPL